MGTCWVHQVHDGSGAETRGPVSVSLPQDICCPVGLAGVMAAPLPFFIPPCQRQPKIDQLSAGSPAQFSTGTDTFRIGPQVNGFPGDTAAGPELPDALPLDACLRKVHLPVAAHRRRKAE
jgi:hypothetical protein